ncbi:MAG: hypothetical protein AAFY76_20195 [Cyanobacteria bacterium J06649_11]
MIADNPEEPVYCVKDLMNLGFESYILSIAVYQHTTDDISRCKEMLPDKLVPAPDNMKLHEINVDRIGDVFQLSYKINLSQQKKNFNVIPGPPAIRKTASRITSSRTFTKNEVEQQQKEDQHIECDQKVTKEKQPVKQVKQKPNDSSLQKRLD